MLNINQSAPDFKGVKAYQAGEFKDISLSDYNGSWLVLFFYPRDFTFVCPTEIRGFARHEADFKALGCDILAASTDSEWSHKAWFERDLSEVKFPILADTTHSLAKDYGVLNESDGSADRGLFIIDPEGKIQYVVISPGSVGRSVNETLRVLKAIQSGELCPIEWNEGETTLGKA
ncbi:MAG: peroxiredoxin [Clostridia bacterium]|nr:peroxiredoxin [Clostridia bacterium]